jgi:hypothetical protein
MAQTSHARSISWFAVAVQHKSAMNQAAATRDLHSRVAQQWQWLLELLRRGAYPPF